MIVALRRDMFGAESSGLIETFRAEDYDHETFVGVRTTPTGMAWLQDHLESLVLHRPAPNASPGREEPSASNHVDELPF